MKINLERKRRIVTICKRPVMNVVQLIGTSGVVMLVMIIILLIMLLTGCTAADDCAQGGQYPQTTGSAVVFSGSALSVMDVGCVGVLSPEEPLSPPLSSSSLIQWRSGLLRYTRERS